MNWIKKLTRPAANPGEAVPPPVETVEAPPPAPALKLTTGIADRLPVALGRYHLIRPLDTWGTEHEVYLAEFEGLKGQKYALKALALDPDDDVARDRFEREIGIYKELNHPAVARMFDWGLDDESIPFLVMELLEGEVLARRIAAEAPMPLATATTFTGHLLQGLEAIHARGIVHRNIKPENLFVTTEGQLKILDFGLARMQGKRVLTATGSSLGTPGFIAPEQSRDAKHVDLRADLFSVGVVLYNMLSGRVPLEASAIEDMISKITNWELTPITTWRPDLPPAVTEWLDKMLQRDREQRYATAREARQALTF